MYIYLDDMVDLPSVNFPSFVAASVAGSTENSPYAINSKIHTASAETALIRLGDFLMRSSKIHCDTHCTRSGLIILRVISNLVLYNNHVLIYVYGEDTIYICGIQVNTMELNPLILSMELDPLVKLLNIPGSDLNMAFLSKVDVWKWRCH